MKTKLLLLAALAFASSSSFAQVIKTLPFYDSFDYGVSGTDKLFEVGESVSAKSGNAWYLYNQIATATTAPSIVDQPFTTVPANYTAPTGNALNIVGSGDDPLVTFTEQGNDNVDLFASFIMRIPTPTSTDNWTNTTGEYFFSFVKLSSGGVPNNYTSNIYIKRISGTSNFNLGVAETNSVSLAAWSPTTYAYDTDYVIVIRYQFDTTINTTGLSSMWVNPVISTTTMPAATVSTTTDLSTSPRIKAVPANNLDSNLKFIRINKNSNANTPNIVMDEIRIANSWWKVLNLSTPLSVAQNDIKGLSVYPNPITDGKLFINSDSGEAKKVVIYNVLGKQVLSKEVTSGLVDVSTIIKGTYVMKITENGKTSTRKIVIN